MNRSITEKNIAVAGVPAKKVSNNGRTRWNVKKNQESTLSHTLTGKCLMKADPDHITGSTSES